MSAPNSTDESATEYSAASKLGFGIALLFIVAFWGATFPVVKNATRDFSVLGFLALRFAVAAGVMAPLGVRYLTRSTVTTGAMLGIVFVSAYLFQTYGLQWTTSSNSGVITGMFIVFVPITGRLLFRTRTSMWLWVGLILSMIGLVLLTDAAVSGLQLGDGLTLLCAAAFGLHVTLIDRYASEFDAIALTFVQLSFCALVTACCWPALESVQMPMPEVWAAIFATALIGSALALFIQTKAQQRLPAVTAALIIMTEPVFAALFSQWLLGERLSVKQWSGAALMVLATMLAGFLPLIGRRRSGAESV